MWNKLKTDFKAFMNDILNFAQEANLDASNLEIDHAALRFKKAEDVDLLLSELKDLSNILSQAVVNGRKIYILKLNKPLVFKNYSIPCLELPYPSKDHDYPKDGWEHVEFVIQNSNPDTLQADFKSIFPNFNDEYKERFNYRISTPKVEIAEQLLNTTIALEKHKGLALKFHCYPIEKVVTSKI